ncbi:GTP-binding protein RAD-like [Adelges cooleyi]|uniref:GTP-binding protein RAD-like n=1 Tax=Adelges cooleyi TaxID=133065 RepID=UPI0021802B86|nr:GTP-binding protein RAD-like [Adelges cooleyi]
MMSVYRSSTPITTFYGSDYRPDDEPSSEAVLEEKRILDHQLRRPSPSRRTPSTMSAIRPPSTTRPGTSQSLRVRTSGSSPRRSLQRSTAFRSKRSITITDRGRTASMPAVPVIKPSFGHVSRPDGPVLEEYRLRSFSITASGVCNLGDFVRYAPPNNVVASNQRLPVAKRDSCPASVSGSPIHQNAAAAAAAHTVCTEFSRFRKPSTALINKFKANDTVESYKVALLGAPGVGKTTISVQFSTSEYICVYDTSIDEDCACRTIRVMINGQEAELSIIDIPYKEMSIETLCSTYNPNVFIVMYSIVDERSFDMAEQMLLFLWKGEYIHTRGVILVGNKSDLERTRRIQTSVGRNLAYSWNCKFIETSGGIDHNVDKLLVGILAQIKLNPIRERMYNSKRKKYSVTRLYKNFLSALRGVKSSENLFSI